MVTVVLVVLALVALYLVVSAIVQMVTNRVRKVVDILDVDAPLSRVEPEISELLRRAPGTELTYAGQSVYELTYRFYPGWPFVLAVLMFPIGILVVFFAREKLRLTVKLTAEGDRTRISVAGKVHQKFAEAIGEALELAVRNLSRSGSARRS